MATDLLYPFEVDLLCEYAEIDAPFPLEVPSSGTSDAERSVLYQASRVALEERGLAGPSGPAGLAGEFVRLLRDRTGALDLVVFGEAASLRAVLLVDPESTLLAVQRSDDAEEAVRLREYPLDRAVDALIRLIPEVEQGGSSPFTLPTRALRAADAAMQEKIEAGEPFREDELPEMLERHGVDDRVMRRMVAHLQPLLGQGQLGGSRPNRLPGDDQEDIRFGTELSWIDTTRGRYRLTQEHDWVSVNPLGREDMRLEARRLLAPLRNHH